MVPAMTEPTPTSGVGRLSKLWQVAHWAIIVNFALQIAYGSYMVFFVVRPEGVSGPLGAVANAIPPEMMITRRLYASETWLAIVGLALYIAITEILPRRLAHGRSSK